MTTRPETNRRHDILLKLMIYLIALNALAVLYSSLLLPVLDRDSGRGAVAFTVPLISAITTLYLTSLLVRRKHVAWIAAMLVYTFALGAGSNQLLGELAHHSVQPAHILRTVAFPLFVLLVLALTRTQFYVRSDIRAFRISLRFIALIMAITFAYGITGFMVLDQRDFHQDISLPEAAHRTIDQFNLTTTHPLKPSTKRARLFLDSLTVVSAGAIIYAALSLVQPIRARYTGHASQRRHMKDLLDSGLGNSEDYFKIWPQDKLYQFSDNGDAGLAYKVERGVALVAADVVGPARAIGQLLDHFEELCFTNDWTPAFIHIDPKSAKRYKQRDYTLQKIGEEAVVDIAHFDAEVRGNKYFRHIRNKFTKQGYTADVLVPPHAPEVVARLRAVSDEWLKMPGRTERGFMMGYFSDDYMQRCVIHVIRDSEGTIQAFLNQLPAADTAEGNFDLMRHAAGSPGNINDFLLLNFISYLADKGYERINLGLCPLSGLDTDDAERSVINNALQFLYSNGDRFYSFSGLRRFKSKYEPNWTSRYIAYRGGIAGFTRVMNALTRAMRVK